LALFPDSEKLAGDWADPHQAEAAHKEWDVLLAVRDEALKALETARNDKLIGSSVEAALKITAPRQVYEVLARHEADLRYLFIVSAVTLEEAPSGNGSAVVTVQVSKAPGQKCERCWNYSTHVGEDKSYPTVCERCSAALKEIEAGAPAT
jgi:isoleucyl-tRNA synthetase